jgi:hypothetical protein
MLTQWNTPEEMYADCPGALHPALAGGEAFYVDGDDHLLVQVTNTVAGVSLICSGRQLLLDGSLKPFSVPLTVTSDGVTRSTLEPLAQGWILSATVKVTAGVPTTSSTFVVLQLVRGGQGQLEVATLQQGFVTATQRVRFPGEQPPASSTSGVGTPTFFGGTTPGAGANMQESVAAAHIWTLTALTLTLTCSATVANRVMRLQMTDGGGNVAGEVVDSAPATASQVVIFSFTNGPNYLASGGGVLDRTIGIGLWRMAAGTLLKTAIVNLQAGDQISAINYLVQQE